MTKRIFDLIFSVILLVFLTPIILATGVLIRVFLGKGVLFRQERTGKGAESFTLFKFRTMIEAKKQNGRTLGDEERMTSFGSFLRKASLDELPELFNVIRGDMSLVGPRPLLMEYVPLYSAKQARRHEVKPGITGWAQVNGRNAIAWDEKFELDVWYVDNQTLLLDLKILLLTLIKVLRVENINEEGHVTTKKFRGTSK